MKHDPRSGDQLRWWLAFALDLFVLAIVLGLSHLGAPGWVVLLAAIAGMWLAGKAARALDPPS